MNILIYNHCFFQLSETFIYTQVGLLSKYYDINLLAHSFKNEAFYPLSAEKKYLVEDTSPKIVRYFNDRLRKAGFYLPYSSSEKKDLEKAFQGNKIDLVHAHFGNNAVNILPFVKKYQLPLIVSFHGYDASLMIRHQKNYLQRLGPLLDYASRIVICSEHMVETLSVSSQNRKKVVLLPYSIDTSIFNPSVNGVQHHNGVINILHSGRIVAKKGVPDLAAVFGELAKKYSNIRLHILGDGNELDQVKQIVANYQCEDKVIFYGAQPNEKVKELMAAADIFVLNSRVSPNGDMEGFPVSILEAMSMGKAVVSTRHAGIPVVLKNEQNGFLVPEKNNDELLKAIEMLILDEQLRKHMGEEARKTVVENFDIRHFEKKLLNIYKEVL